eukprot:3859119-Prymnesium_polylepis.1
MPDDSNAVRLAVGMAMGGFPLCAVFPSCTALRNRLRPRRAKSPATREQPEKQEVVVRVEAEVEDDRRFQEADDADNDAQDEEQVDPENLSRRKDRNASHSRVRCRRPRPARKHWLEFRPAHLAANGQ